MELSHKDLELRIREIIERCVCPTCGAPVVTCLSDESRTLKPDTPEETSGIVPDNLPVDKFTDSLRRDTEELILEQISKSQRTINLVQAIKDREKERKSPSEDFEDEGSDIDELVQGEINFQGYSGNMRSYNERKHIMFGRKLNEFK